MPAPKVFISYSHETQQHKDWVRSLASALRANGIDAVLDQWDLSAGQDIAAFMAGGIRTADRVLLICTDAYLSKAEAGTGGVRAVIDRGSRQMQAKSHLHLVTSQGGKASSRGSAGHTRCRAAPEH
jgi:hypothetical protein